MLISSRHICIRSIFGSFSLTTIYSIQTLMAPRCLGFLCKQAGSGGGVGEDFSTFLKGLVQTSGLQTNFEESFCNSLAFLQYEGKECLETFDLA